MFEWWVKEYFTINICIYYFVMFSTIPQNVKYNIAQKWKKVIFHTADNFKGKSFLPLEHQILKRVHASTYCSMLQ